ncbi:hypothetical protein BT93_L3987 [Corymbia citriodora subsp. variegata]|uniref:Uncharacterized protein n=1 Tax=Corymbia citriodora subsp. variegata TaxID=360336 RepID=A0A8T0CGD6_CORYI|nr:hypothetical protein BT93_L3987 [Corymbia citriodora subsp. variegata]
MHHSAISPKQPLLLLHATLSENPPLRIPVPLTASLHARWHPLCASSSPSSSSSCRDDGRALPLAAAAAAAAGLHSSAPSGSATAGYGGCSSSGGEKARDVAAKDVDVATLGNLCVDIVLSVPALPRRRRRRGGLIWKSCLLRRPISNTGKLEATAILL